jgi:hypothetical protein
MAINSLTYYHSQSVASTTRIGGQSLTSEMLSISDVARLPMSIRITPTYERQMLLTVGTQLIWLEVERDEAGDYIASEAAINPFKLNLYGVGTSPQEAVIDYKDMLFELYDDLSTSENKLSRRLQHQLTILKQIVDPQNKQ